MNNEPTEKLKEMKNQILTQIFTKLETLKLTTIIEGKTAPDDNAIINEYDNIQKKQSKHSKNDREFIYWYYFKFIKPLLEKKEDGHDNNISPN
jgi:hypothetical protein